MLRSFLTPAAADEFEAEPCTCPTYLVWGDHWCYACGIMHVGSAQGCICERAQHPDWACHFCGLAVELKRPVMVRQWGTNQYTLVLLDSWQHLPEAWSTTLDL